MHRKTSTATERLVALRAFAAAVASRTGVALVQAVAAALIFLGRSASDIRNHRAGDLRNHRATEIRSVLAALVRRGALGMALGRRRPVPTGLAAASVLALALLAGTAALVAAETPTTTSVAVADGEDRLAAADRADRASRDAAPATPAPAAADPAAAAPVLAAPLPNWVSPMAGIPLSSCFGPRWGAMHLGMDFAGPSGTPILTVGAGTVFSAGWLYAGYGQSVVIDHGDGYFTHYAHASRINVAPGQQVTAGQIIAWEGSTGDSTGPHLHFEVHQGLWTQVNPAAFLRQRGVAVGC